MWASRPVRSVRAAPEIVFLNTDIYMTVFQGFNQILMSCKLLPKKQLYEHIFLKKVFNSVLPRKKTVKKSICYVWPKQKIINTLCIL